MSYTNFKLVQAVEVVGSQSAMQIQNAYEYT